MAQALSRIEQRARSMIIDWKPFVIANVDVAQIKDKLINNNEQALWGPLVKTMAPAITAVKDAMTGLGQLTKHEKNIEAAATAKDLLKAQIGVSAICVAVYVTAHGDAAPSTKAANFRQVTIQKVHGDCAYK